MGDSKDDSSFSPPPMAELGNYKGVMLCNRPTAMDALKVEPTKPFRSAIPATVGDALGLIRKRPHATHEVKKRGPSAALRRHCRWIKELQQQVAEEAQVVEHEEIERDRRQRIQKEVFRKQRDAIRLIKLSAGAAEDLTSVLNPKAPKAKGASKPAWAMTEGEKEEKEASDFGQLINFVEDLDYDEYIHDLEFRECLQAVTDRARRLQREQEAFKDSLLQELNQETNDSPSERLEEAVPRSNLNDLNERPEWDASAPQDSTAKALAEKAWQEGPFKAVHSKTSLRKIAEREVKEPDNT